MRRHPASLAPVLLLLAMTACKGNSGNNSGPQGPPLQEIEIPEKWSSNEASVVLRLTNSGTASTETKRALNTIFNDPEGEIDPIDFLMRRPERDDAGNLVAPDSSKPIPDLLAGTSIEQLEAYRQRIVDGSGAPFSREEAVDSCGNEIVMTTVSPHVMQEVFSAPEDLPVWPASCPDGIDCNTAEAGAFDVGMTEVRFDGMVDMVVNVFPDLQVSPPQPGLWGHFNVFFPSTNNPGFPALSMFANIRRIQVNILGLWQLDRAYVDPMGVREVFRFPHRARTLTQGDVLVFAEPYEQTEEYWAASPYGVDNPVPVGSDLKAPLLLDVTSEVGAAVEPAITAESMLLDQLGKAFQYQIAAGVSCPTVEETAYLREGPVEFFLCPDIDIGTCIATEDMEEAACAFENEIPFDPFNPFAQPVTFPRIEITSPADQPNVPTGQLPVYLSSPVEGFEATVLLDVDEDSVLYMYNPERIVSAALNTTGLPVELPAPQGNSHCIDKPVQRFDIGSAWGPGTYELSVSFEAGADLLTDVDGNSLVWLYYSSIPTWVPPGG
jgi:hypothetical protein